MIFEEDDGDYENDDYLDFELDNSHITVLIIFEAFLCVAVILLLYFLYDVMSMVFVIK